MKKTADMDIRGLPDSRVFPNEYYYLVWNRRAPVYLLE